MNKELQISKLLLNKIQTILIDSQFRVLETSNLIFNLTKKANLPNWNPFFEILNDITFDKEQFYEFNCIQFEVNNSNYIVDVFIEKLIENNFYKITILDLTKNYQSLQEVTQNKNTKAIENFFCTKKTLKNKTLKKILKQI